MQQVVVSVYKWKRLDHAEDTNSKSEVTQTNISANMEMQEQKCGQHQMVFDTSICNTPPIK